MIVKHFLLIFLFMLVTFGVRYPVLALVGRYDLPEPLKRALRFVPVAVLSALCAPMVLIQDNQWALSFSNVYLIASIVAILVAWKSRHLLLTIVVGMLVFTTLKLAGFG